MTRLYPDDRVGIYSDLITSLINAWHDLHEEERNRIWADYPNLASTIENFLNVP